MDGGSRPRCARGGMVEGIRRLTRLYWPSVSKGGVLRTKTRGCRRGPRISRKDNRDARIREGSEDRSSKGLRSHLDEKPRVHPIRQG